MKRLRVRWIAQVFFCTSLLLMLFSPLGAHAQSNQYYVSSSGSDSNSGTSLSSAWATIGHALSTFSLGSGGAVIHVQAGTYGTSNSINRGGSSPTVRLVIQCDPGVASASAAIGQCKITGSGTYGFLGNANNIDIVGFDIGNNASLETAIDVKDNGARPVSGTGNSFHVIGNYIHDLASGVSGNGVGCPLAGAVLYQYKVTDAQVLGNIILRYGAIPSGGGGVSSCNNAHGIYMDSADAVIENNIVVQTADANIQYFHMPCMARIANNTLISGNEGIYLTGAPNSAECPTGIGMNSVVNNIFGFHNRGHIFLNGSGNQCSGTAPNFISHNISDGIRDFNTATDSCNLVSPNPWTHEAPTTTFANYQTNGTGDYHLKSTSSAIGAGTTSCVSGTASCTPTNDLAGIARPIPPSIGAYESGSSASTTINPPTGLTASAQ